MTMLLVLGACIPASTSSQSTGEVELKYDDGMSDGSCSTGSYGLIVHFSPPATPFVIDKIKIFANLRGTGYKSQNPEIEIWDKNFTVVHYWQESTTTFSREPSWMTLDVSNITVDGDFSIVFYPNSTKDDGVYLNYDSSVRNRHSEVVLDGQIADWIFERIPKEKANWMIRVIGIPTD